uniref:Uncharacterized protein n=1 Tax=Timema tahoe TaxID=61484 RepID=A0A7R9P1K5_9NEOP|nr:unnamed protein product [Timema tahoe]
MLAKGNNFIQELDLLYVHDSEFPGEKKNESYRSPKTTEYDQLWKRTQINDWPWLNQWRGYREDLLGLSKPTVLKYWKKNPEEVATLQKKRKKKPVVGGSKLPDSPEADVTTRRKEWENMCMDSPLLLHTTEETYSKSFS